MKFKVGDKVVVNTNYPGYHTDGTKWRNGIVVSTSGHEPWPVEVSRTSGDGSTGSFKESELDLDTAVLLSREEVWDSFKDLFDGEEKCIHISNLARRLKELKAFKAERSSYRVSFNADIADPTDADAWKQLLMAGQITNLKVEPIE